MKSHRLKPLRLTGARDIQRLMFCLIVILLAMLSPLAVMAATSPPPTDVLSVAKGQSLLLEYKGVTRVSVGDGEMLQVEVLKRDDEILLIALKPGTTDLRLWSRGEQPTRYVVEVYDDAERVAPDDLNRLIDGVDGVAVEPVGRSFAIKGKARTEAGYRRLQAIADRYPTVASYADPPDFEVKPTILMQARLLEIRRSALKELGISWSQFLNGPVVGILSDFSTNSLFRLTGAPDGSAIDLPLDAGTKTFAGISTQLSSTINLLMENGDARLLAEPTLSCISGGDADFLVGGEVPIPVRDENGTPSVEFKEFGIILRFAPIADQDHFIRTDLQVEVSSIDPSIQVLGIPGFATRKTNTKMNVAEGQTMVIAGLVSQEDAKNVEKVPLLGQVPILGELFKSRAFRNQETELVILMTPRIIEPNSPRNRAYQARFDDLIEQTDESLKFNILD